MLLPILGVSLLQAADMIGSKTAYAPAHYSNMIFMVSIAVGLAAGLITGCIGAGGGFIITPALMAAGVKGILAVGTDLFHIFAKAIMGTSVIRSSATFPSSSPWRSLWDRAAAHLSAAR